MTPRLALDPMELSLLRLVRVSDEDHGGLALSEVDRGEFEVLGRLCDRRLVEAIGEFGEAPDGEEDERESGASAVVYRVTELGVLALRDADQNA